MLESINLSLSCACGGNCIFCPSNRGRRLELKIMPFANAKKIIDEVASPEFKEVHKIKRFEVGDNGDAFLNRDIIKILRYLKARLPEVVVELFTNFQNFSEAMAETILSEKLLDSIVLNIDGSNEENYFNVKRLNFNKTKRNLSTFLNLRKKLNSAVPLRVLVLTLNNYIHTIYNNFGFYPAKLTDKNLIKIKDDFALIKEQFKKLLDLKKDKIVKSWVIGWAEREQIDINKINYRNYSCPYLIRVKREAIIAPDGTWYACCLDANAELVLGNVVEKSINEIYFSQRRKTLIERLEKKEFSTIGGPCRTVNCCQIVNRRKFLNVFSRFILKHDFLIDLLAGNMSSLSIKNKK